MMPDDPLSPPPKKPVAVPVYNCHVYVSPRSDEGLITARSSALPEVVVQGKTEREALQQVVQAFKKAILAYESRQEAIPWLETPLDPLPGETPRWIAVHL